jgi:hypothetical protein
MLPEFARLLVVRYMGTIYPYIIMLSMLVRARNGALRALLCFGPVTAVVLRGFRSVVRDLDAIGGRVFGRCED